MSASTKLYDQDFVGWAETTARLLREGRLDQLDIENLAAEVKALAGKDRRELRSRLRVLIVHLLKWGWQPEKRSGNWSSTIRAQRTGIGYLLEDSPSLKRSLAPSLQRAYREAAEEAALETDLFESIFPRECPFSVDQILDEDFLPEG